MQNIKLSTNNNKSYKKLGFTYLETAELVINLKRLLANYQVHYHNLRNFHWNVEGPEFFELHEEFENEYNQVQEQIDEIAERIRVFGLKPSMSLRETLQMSDIREAKEGLTALEMVRFVLKDFGIMHQSMLDVINAALENGDTVTEQMITKFMNRLEKRNWMFTAWCK